MEYSVDIIIEELLKTYRESKAKTALVGALQTAYGFVGRLRIVAAQL